MATVLAQLGGDPTFASVRTYLEEVRRGDSAIAQRIREVPVGETRRIELAGGAFALEQAYRAKPRHEGFFESHAKFIDVQVIVDGEEAMEVADAAQMTIEKSLDPQRDLIVYRDTAGASILKFGRGTAAVFFPADVHMPGLYNGAASVAVHKTVLKVPVLPQSA
ncbi:YhcH/YjgK/YiaL family protein [Opitutus terrae]|uniref:YhcH/YjgK/YiaL family protein n=1 Tax=Opitutus terrae TaxID=107709 RepID=UPI0002EF06A3|nr:YhcH/YjgK/YiaL family protein [Opitutus terrae]